MKLPMAIKGKLPAKGNGGLCNRKWELLAVRSGLPQYVCQPLFCPVPDYKYNDRLDKLCKKRSIDG